MISSDCSMFLRPLSFIHPFHIMHFHERLLIYFLTFQYSYLIESVIHSNLLHKSRLDWCFFIFVLVESYCSIVLGLEIFRHFVMCSFASIILFYSYFLPDLCVLWGYFTLFIAYILYFFCMH